ncbi:MAG: 50S ribosomal protein L19 [Halanaerobiales bacterium]|nr:50S ribosomal protein L19 [Halanaerobiales bacterium]
MNIIDQIEREQMRDDIPQMNIGDTVAVHYRVIEGGKERIQVYEGYVIRRQNGGARETITVRKLSHGLGVERTFPVHSPKVAKYVVKRHAHVSRAKLYYLRGTIGKKAKLRDKNAY